MLHLVHGTGVGLSCERMHTALADVGRPVHRTWRQRMKPIILFVDWSL